MAWGYFKKLVIADRLAPMVDQVYANVTEYQGLSLIATVLAFAVQIYCDFSGYSDIAIGAAKVLGFELHGKLPPALLRAKCAGVLAAVAHHPLHLVP